MWATYRKKLATFYAQLHMYLVEATERGGGEEQQGWDRDHPWALDLLILRQAECAKDL